MTSLSSAAINLNEAFIQNVASHYAPTSDSRIIFQEAFNIIYGYILLSDDKFLDVENQKVSDKIKIKAYRLLGFLRHKFGFASDKTIPDFMEWAKIMSFEDDNSDFEDTFYTPKETMLKAGFRAIDMQLYIEAERFNYNGVKALLEKGANPNVWFPFEISEKDLPLPKDLSGHFEIDSTSAHVLSYACDFFDCYDGMSDFKNIINNTPISHESSLMMTIMTCGANALLYQLIKPYDKE